MTIIDTHTHFHDPVTATDLQWPKPDAPYHRTCMPDTYRAEIGTRRVIAVETSPRRKDDLRLMEFAAKDPLISGYISNLQPLAPGFDHRLSDAITDPKWCGLRLRPITDFDLKSKPLIAALDRLAGYGHVELGITEPSRLGALRDLCLELPHIHFVLTHSGHPPLSARDPVFDDTLLEGLDNLFVKISPPQRGDIHDAEIRAHLADHVTHLVRRVSEERLMFGSNWPVTQYPQYFEDWLAQTLRGAQADVTQVLCHTAKSLYRCAF